jgi:hypothetical protein
MRDAVERSVPTRLEPDEWHLPLVGEAEREETSSAEELAKIAIGRCARVSYLTHAGTRDLSADVALYDRLLESGHMSPMEHVARPMSAEEMQRGRWSGNFQGWIAHRKLIPGEPNPLGKIEEIEIGSDESVAA